MLGKTKKFSPVFAVWNTLLRCENWYLNCLQVSFTPEPASLFRPRNSLFELTPTSISSGYEFAECAAEESLSKP